MIDSSYPSLFEHCFSDIEALRALLQKHEVEEAYMKLLPRNANDKNQVYVASDFGVLFDTFSMTFQERGDSTSISKRGSAPGRRITEAVFDEFLWLKRDGTEAKGKRVKAIVYPQYPEARLSGFQTLQLEMPASMAVSWTKANPDSPRLLVLGRRGNGSCLALVAINIPEALISSFKRAEGTPRARAWKRLECASAIERVGFDRLKEQLTEIVGRSWRGSRLDKEGNVLPFKGTQVCGYTLERALDIRPNASKDGDIYGIELKTFTSNRLTLFTPEPDLGLYASDFRTFMHKYGYRDANGNYRLTGTHRSGAVSKKSGLTLQVVEYRIHPDTKSEWIRDEHGDRVRFPYDPNRPLSEKVDALEVLLLDAEGNIASGWSFERLMNCWGAKHNHVVFIPAKKEKTEDPEAREQGYEFNIHFSNEIFVGMGTSAERLFQAIDSGVIYLDPAPKLMAEGSGHKRRSQWRVGDIHKAVDALYDKFYMIKLKPEEKR